MKDPLVLAQIERQWQWRSEQNLLSSGPTADFKNESYVVLLEDIRSLWNVGSIFRTADGAGFSRLYLCGITGAPPRKEIAKTSLGAELHIPWQFHKDALEIIPTLKQNGVMIVGLERAVTSVPLSQALADQRLTTPLCVVVGNEVTGISPEVLNLCDIVCDLPMRGTKESLNVAVAFGIAAYLLCP